MHSVCSVSNERSKRRQKNEEKGNEKEKERARERDRRGKNGGRKLEVGEKKGVDVENKTNGAGEGASKRRTASR